MIKIADSFLNKQGFQYFIQSLKTKLKQKANISDLPTKISDLENDEDYVDSETVDSKITSAVSEITSFEYQIVDTLPSHGEKGVVYLIKHTHDTDDNYDEYIWVNDKFEKIGSTDIDLSEYAKKSEVDSSVEIINEDVSSLKQDLSTENEVRKEADATLETSLNAEIMNRTSSDDEIKAILTTESEERTTSDNTLKDSIVEETNSRIKADSNLQSSITAVDERVDTLTEELTTEEETRQNADASLQSNIDVEIVNRQTADNTLQTNIDAESEARQVLILSYKLVLILRQKQGKRQTQSFSRRFRPFRSSQLK